MLDDKLLAVTNKTITETAPGRYTLKALFGDAWYRVTHRPRAFGNWFRKSLKGGFIAGVRWVRKRSDKSNEYEVLPRVRPTLTS